MKLSLGGMAAKFDFVRHSPKFQFGSIAKLSKSSLESGSTGSKNTYLNSQESVTMFCDTMEIDKIFYLGINKKSIHLAAGSKNAKTISSGTYCFDAITLQNSLHEGKLIDTSVSVGHLCDKESMAIFTEKYAIVMKKKEISVNKNHVFTIPDRENSFRFYEIN